MGDFPGWEILYDRMETEGKLDQCRHWINNIIEQLLKHNNMKTKINQHKKPALDRCMSSHVISNVHERRMMGVQEMESTH